MKKIISLLIVVAFAIIGINNRVNAGYYSSNPDETGGDIYHVKVGDQRAYVHFTLPRYLNDIYNNSYTSNTAHEITFYDSQNIWFDRYIDNPDTSLFNTFVVESKDENGNYVNEFFSMDEQYNQLRFMGTQDGIEISYRTPAPFSYTEPFFYLFDNTTYRVYWTKSNTYTGVTVEDLPTTVGSPFVAGPTGKVSFETNGSYLDVTILYENEYKLNTMLVDDISIFENVVAAYYYTDLGSKYITMSYENEPVFLSSIPVSARPWAETITWNLTTNQIRSINKVEVFAYHYKAAERNINTYMYIPNLVHDNVISVTAGFQYQFDYHFTGKGEIQTDLVTLNAGANNTYSPTWEKKLISYYGNASKLPIDSAFRKWLGLSDPYQKSITQITYIQNPTSELKDRITTAWNEKYNTNVQIDTNTNKLYVLNWGQYDKFGAKDVYLIEDSFNFAEIVFVSNGKVSFLDFDDILLSDITDPTLEPKETTDIFSKFFEKFWGFMEKFLFPTLIALSLIGAKIFTAFLPKKYAKSTRVYAFTALAIFIFLFVTFKG